MVETDWREILSFSQKELHEKDKELLCESLSWMEADDIELNFSDLKTLFRLAQDILKYKSEQVNNLRGKLETVNRKSGKKKGKHIQTDSPISNDSAIETIAHQEEEIKANKDILEQLYADIAELEGRKSKLLDNKPNLEDSDTSRDALSEMDAVVQLENEVARKNKHIRKLLGDIKNIEEENENLKKKTVLLKDKLTEATQIIDNLTEQLLSINNECVHLKEILGKSEKFKAQHYNELESLRQELSEKESNAENILQDVKAKVQHWKNIAKAKKTEVEALSQENISLKEELNQVVNRVVSVSKEQTSHLQKTNVNEEKIKELQEKLIEASAEIERSANLITLLKSENRHLKRLVEETPDSSTLETRNQSDDGKERILINKLKRKIKNLSASLQNAEEIIEHREKELAEISSELQLLQSNDGIKTISDSLKHKKQELKMKDEGIKSLVKEINSLNGQLNNLQLENETLREKLSIPLGEEVSTERIVKKFKDIEKTNTKLFKDLRDQENKLVEVELTNRKLNDNLTKLSSVLHKLGYSKTKIEEMIRDISDDENVPVDDTQNISKETLETQKENDVKNYEIDNAEIKNILEENEGLRKGMQEILDFLKDNSTTSSGILSLQCPSLEALLRSMEARHSAGWFAPHMATIMELRAAIGGKDALLVALHEARKETYEVMSQLNKESIKTTELERKIKEIENDKQLKQTVEPPVIVSNKVEFGSWMDDKESNQIDFNHKTEIDDFVTKGNSMYEDQLKKGLEYFCNKFKSLYDKLATLTIQTADDQNKWLIQEEQYKALIENLKSQILEHEDEDVSDKSPGIVPIPNPVCLQRKCYFLEESYKYIRTLNENLKNEIMEAKKENMTMASEYEAEIQKLILAVANLTDKLRNSISIELFWKQNASLNEVTGKYRKVLESKINQESKSDSLLDRLNNFRFDILNQLKDHVDHESSNKRETLTNVEENVLKKQLEELCIEVDSKNKRIELLENNIRDLHEVQNKIIDNSLSSLTQQDMELLKSQQSSAVAENNLLNEKCKHLSSQLDIALLQLQEFQQRQLSNDMEVNLLRHQILDLQSTSDNKAVVSRLSSEVLVAHLQASESYKKIERLNASLIKEKELRVETEEMLKARQKIFDVYSFRYESKFRYMFEVMQVLRQQYQGSIPLTSIENYLNKVEEISRENKVLNEKLQEIEDLRSSLMAKHSLFDQILDVSRNKCVNEEDSCQHKLKAIMMESVHNRELEHVHKKLRMLEQSRDELTKEYNQLEKTLVLINQGFEKSNLNDLAGRKSVGEVSIAKLELEDIHSDDDSSSSSRRSKTITLPKPQVLKPINDKNGPKNPVNINTENANDNATKKVSPNVTKVVASPVKTQNIKKIEMVSAQIQTIGHTTKHALVQTFEDKNVCDLKENLNKIRNDYDKQSKELQEAMTLVQQRANENLKLNTEKLSLEANIQTLKANITQKDKLVEILKKDIEKLSNDMENIRDQQLQNFKKSKETAYDENKSLILALKQMEADKNVITTEFKEILKNEREEFAKTVKNMNIKIMELQSQLDNGNTVEATSTNTETSKEFVDKYTMKIVKLQDQCFKLQSDLDECKAELSTYKTEAERWKELAIERLTKMEHLNAQLEERHCHEVDSYKAENQHWLSQLNETQREHLELRTRLTEQKAIYVKQLSEKDAQIEQMRSVIHNLKTQIMSMQTMISVHDPSFDLSAIVEVEETSDAISHPGSDRLEIKFDSSGELNDMTEDFARIQSSSTAIWNEPIIERLRRDKQLAGKQNAILRRQIKALAARERRSRLDAQNLKNQVFRISTSGNKVTTAETAALHNKIATLQAQLTSARRETHSSIALWDKWKRAQQACDRWQARYEDKCQEVKKLENSLNLTKSALHRLDREKRLLMSRMAEHKCDSNQLSIEKQENESPEKSYRSNECVTCMNASSISNQALLERVQAQQRRIAALEVAEKGNELLVSEYERALAEITSLKGQVLKLESTLLESQIRMPIKSDNDTQPELEYWKNYCEMLKEENVQLNLRVNSLDTIPTTASQHRINDLEQTVLMLRGLVSKLQAEQKSGISMGAHKRIDSRPSSGRSVNEKNRSQQETLRIEIANLKRTLQDKDHLLERSKEMLKIAAEREDDLLRENAFLRRQIDELTQPKQGFLSA